MPLIGLGIPCPVCGKELSIEGGLTPNLLREAIRLRADQGSVPVTCSNCGSETAIHPTPDDREQESASGEE